MCCGFFNHIRNAFHFITQQLIVVRKSLWIVVFTDPFSYVNFDGRNCIGEYIEQSLERAMIG